MKKSRTRWGMRLAAVTLICTALYFLFFPERCSASMTNALRLSICTVVPAVFPYLVLSGTFVASGLADRVGYSMQAFTRKLLGLPGCCGGVILLGILCGFPVGGKMAGMLYQRGSITKNEAERLIAVSDFCGPAYIFSVLGAGILKSFVMGAIIFAVQTVLSIGMGILLGVGKRESTSQTVLQSNFHFMDAFTDSVKNACATTLQICGYVTFFAALMSVFSSFFAKLPLQFAALFYGFFEMSGGISRLSAGTSSLIPGTIILLWSGLSVFMQVESAATAGDKPKLSMRLYLLVRLIVLPIGTVTVYFLCRMFGLIE